MKPNYYQFSILLSLFLQKFRLRPEVQNPDIESESLLVDSDYKRTTSKLMLRAFCVVLLGLLTIPTQVWAQDPCECAQRWTGGATWNVGGTIDDTPNAGDGIENQDPKGGIIRCGSAAETQSNIQPVSGSCSTYDPNTFDLQAYSTYMDCIDPAIVDIDGNPDPATNFQLPSEGDDIIWIQFDVRANVENYQFQIISNDVLCWALFYLDADGDLANPDGQASSNPICNSSNFVFDRCGTNFPNQWNNLLFDTPSPDEITNFYVAAWRKPGQSGKFNANFKARFGCDVDLENPTCAANNDGPVCAGSPLMLDGTLFNGTGSETFEWKEGGNTVANTLNASITAPANGGDYTYTLEVYSGSTLVTSCETTVTVFATPACSAGNNGPLCAGATLNLTESGGDATGWSWTGPNGFVSASQNPVRNNVTTADAGDYIVTITDA
ncbi:MAG: hypothetical protein OEM26_10205, partial [Saprospiraceae bacterium]|nr:hypothetical protein [Saprospiraceae bacterium]